MSTQELIGKLNDIQHTIESPYSHELKHDEILKELLKYAKANNIRVKMELNEYGHVIWTEA